MKITVDGHCDSIQNCMEDTFSIAENNPAAHLDLPKMKRGRLDAQFFACWVHPDTYRGTYARRTYELLDRLHSICESGKNKLKLAVTAKQVRKNKKDGFRSAVPCVEGGHAIGNQLSHLRNFRRLGVRYMTLTWMNNNGWAGGSGNTSGDPGLSGFGRRVVGEMNKLGMIVDLSHAAERTFWDAIDCSRAPVIASHSCCSTIHDHHRNLTDAQLEAIAETGGVTGICFYPAHLDPTYGRRLEKYRNERETDQWLVSLPEDRRPDVPIDRIVEHIEHAVDVTGPRHVGLGSDFDGVDVLPDGMNGCAELPILRKKLENRGFPEKDVDRIFGHNFLRVLAETEQAAGSNEKREKR